MPPSGMDGLERAALTEKSRRDASRRPGRRRFSALVGGRGRGRGQQLASVNAERAGIVEIYGGCCCRWKPLRSGCAAPCLWMCCTISSGGGTRQHTGCGTHVSKMRDCEQKRKKRWRRGIGPWLLGDFFPRTEVHSAAEYFMCRGSLKAM